MLMAYRNRYPFKKPIKTLNLEHKNVTFTRLTHLKIWQNVPESDVKTMSINANDIKTIARLAKLHLDEAQTGAYQDSLSKIVSLVDEMNAVNTDNVQAMAHPLHMSQRLREDVVTETNQREQLQAPAPAVENGLFLVPKVID